MNYGFLWTQSVLCGDLDWKEIQGRGDIPIHVADSLCYTVETNTVLKGNYTPIKIIEKQKAQQVNLLSYNLEKLGALD